MFLWFCTTQFFRLWRVVLQADTDVTEQYAAAIVWVWIVQGEESAGLCRNVAENLCESQAISHTTRLKPEMVSSAKKPTSAYRTALCQNPEDNSVENVTSILFFFCIDGKLTYAPRLKLGQDQFLCWQTRLLHAFRTENNCSIWLACGIRHSSFLWHPNNVITLQNLQSS